MTAYEMRISDWSSDVCSSDLPLLRPPMKRLPKPLPQRRRIRRHDLEEHRRPLGPGEPAAALADRAAGAGAGHRRPDHGRAAEDAEVFLGVHDAQRSEEHTSELQSLMRISYAVFCLKKKLITKS